MNEMDPDPALSSRPSSEAKVENEKAAPMTKNTSQNTAATTTGPDVVDNIPQSIGGRPNLTRPALHIGIDRGRPWLGSPSVPAFSVLIGASSKK
jgi:hypothetical protein